MSKTKLFLLLFVLSFFSLVAKASGPGPYAGLQVGRSNLNNIPYKVNTGLLGGQTGNCNGYGCLEDPDDPNNTCNICDITTMLVEPANKGISGRLFFGVQLNQYAGFEIGGANYAPSTYKPTIQSNNEPTIRVYAVDINVKGIYQLYNFSVFGKVGGAGVRSTASKALYLDVGADGVSKDVAKGQTAARFTAAVGVTFDLNANWSIDLTGSRIFAGSNFPEADLYSLGLTYHWVDLYCGQFLC
ncbi:outer membrane beta-barrel protein [Gammaproteobacteria bacterium]|nr:outer membrane beta-barrel protein [Gammaproteobacteria bacterium]